MGVIRHFPGVFVLERQLLEVIDAVSTGSDPATAERVVRRSDTPGSLSHMCVLDIENGADHFVLVEGTYRASFFGLTISTLSDREAAMSEEELDACECSGDNMKHIFNSPFVTHQWAAIPQPLKKMLHFLSRCALLVMSCSLSCICRLSSSKNVSGSSLCTSSSSKNGSGGLVRLL